MIQARPWRLRAGAASDQDGQLVDQLLEARNIPVGVTRDHFINPSLQHLPDGTGLPDLEKAAKLLADHLDAGIIGIVGDYDADGICATALLADVLTGMGGKVLTMIPDRFAEGYGVQPLHIKRLVDRGATVVVTVDNGVASFEAANCAARLDIPLIITDHHQPGKTLPEAAANINPALLPDQGGVGPLCGAGVAFYLCTALRRLLREQGHKGGEIPLAKWLDLVAVATIADMVPLQEVNRIFVHRGLSQINANPRLWIRSLARVSNSNPAQIDAEAIAFRLAPRINAAGRIDSADTALQFLRCRDETGSIRGAAHLDALNKQRRTIEEKVEKQVLQTIGSIEEGKVIVAASDNWHPGVVGLASGSLSRKFHVPALVGHIQDHLATCSARSVEGFDLYAALSLIRDRFDRFGGHPAAVGLTLPLDQLSFVRDHLQDQFSQAFPEGYRAPLWIDAVVESTPDMTLLAQQKSMEPFGRGNEKPVYALLNARLSAYKVKGGHMGFRIEGTSDLSGIAWNMGDRLPLPKIPLHLAFTLGEDSYRGGVQMMLLDFASGDPFAHA